MGNKRKPTQAGGGGSAAHNKKKKFSKGPAKGKAQPSQQQDVPLPPESDEEQEFDVGEEDVEFVQQYGSQLGFLKDLDAQELNRAVKEKQRAAAAAAAGGSGDGAEDDAAGSEEDAEEYERKPRAAEQVVKAAGRGLPVKTATGELLFQANRKQQQLQAVQVQVEGVTVQDTLQLEQAQQKAEQAAAKDAEAAAAAEQRRAAVLAAKQLKQQQEKAAAAAQQGELPPALLSLMSIRDQQQRRDALKQQMALAAQHLLAEPDKHVGPGLRLLLSCAGDTDGQVARLALLSLLAVFKDILPGYRIRSLTEDEQEMRVSKEVQALRDFEAALLKSYQAYLKTLLAATATAKPSVPGTSGSSGASSVMASKRVAVRCMGQLLVTRLGFNYSSDLLQALVPLMVGPDGQVAEAACGAIRQLLQEDVQGKTSLEAVQLVADLVRKRRCALPPAVVSSLLVLRFEAVTPTSQGGEGVGGGKAKKLGKKAARRAKRKTDLDRDFEEGEAGPDAAELSLLQSQMLEALFEIFFRVLKHCSAATANHAAQTTAAAAAAAAGSAAAANGSNNSSSRGVLVQPWPAAKFHRKFPLLQCCLVGLGRYSHLISVEYFNDLMAVLQELLASGALPVRERLGVLLAALDVLKGQGEALTIDRRAFYNHLYQTLLLVPLQVLYEGMMGPAADNPAAAAAAGKGAGAAGVAGAAGAVGSAEAEAEDLLEDEQAMQAVRISLQGWEAAAAQQDAAAAAANGASSSSSGSRQVVPTSVLLLRCLEQQLLGVKQTDMGRLAAFTKRLAELMLSATSAEALGMGCLVWRLIRRYSKLACQFEWEGGAPVGGRQFDADCPDPSEAGALAASLWELPLLTQHYHPHVVAAAKALLALTPGAAGAGGGGGESAAAAGGGGGGGGVITGAAGPQELAGVYEVVKQGGFRPAPLAPPAVGGRGKGGAAGAPVGSSKAGMAARQAAAVQPWCEDLHHALAAAASLSQEHDSSQQQQQTKQQKKQKQQQQQQQQAAQRTVSAQAAAAAQAAADGVDVEAVQQAVQQQYQLSRRYRRNQRLRRELAVEAKKVELFREHLIQQREQQQQQQQAQAKQQQLGQPKKKHRSRK